MDVKLEKTLSWSDLSWGILSWEEPYEVERTVVCKKDFGVVGKLICSWNGINVVRKTNRSWKDIDVVGKITSSFFISG